MRSPLLGWRRHMIPIPRGLWALGLSRAAKKGRAATGFMTQEHHRVRDFVVTELPGAGTPLSPERIAEALGLPVERVRAVLAELERRLVFLFRNEEGAVLWAYPVTVDATPHHLALSTGERVNAA